MITITSKQNETVEFSTQISEFVRGLELYDLTQPIIFSDDITTDFLVALKKFYEGAEFKEDKLKIKQEQIKSNNLATTLEPDHLLIMEPFFMKAIKLNSLVPFVELLQGADMLRAPHFKDLVCCTIATLLNYSGKSAFELKKYREKWGLGGEKDTIFPCEENFTPFYDFFAKKLSQNYKNKLDKIFNSDANDTKNTNTDDTLASKIQEQIENGFNYGNNEYDEEVE